MSNYQLDAEFLNRHFDAVNELSDHLNISGVGNVANKWLEVINEITNIEGIGTTVKFSPYRLDIRTEESGVIAFFSTEANETSILVSINGGVPLAKEIGLGLSNLKVTKVGTSWSVGEFIRPTLGVTNNSIVTTNNPLTINADLFNITSGVALKTGNGYILGPYVPSTDGTSKGHDALIFRVDEPNQYFAITGSVNLLGYPDFGTYPPISTIFTIIGSPSATSSKPDIKVIIDDKTITNYNTATYATVSYTETETQFIEEPDELNGMVMVEHTVIVNKTAYNYVYKPSILIRELRVGVYELSIIDSIVYTSGTSLNLDEARTKLLYNIRSSVPIRAEGRTLTNAETNQAILDAGSQLATIVSPPSNSNVNTNRSAIIPADGSSPQVLEYDIDRPSETNTTTVPASAPLPHVSTNSPTFEMVAPGRYGTWTHNGTNTALEVEYWNGRDPQDLTSKTPADDTNIAQINGVDDPTDVLNIISTGTSILASALRLLDVGSTISTTEYVGPGNVPRGYAWLIPIRLGNQADIIKFMFRGDTTNYSFVDYATMFGNLSINYAIQDINNLDEEALAYMLAENDNGLIINEDFIDKVISVITPVQWKDSYVIDGVVGSDLPAPALTSGVFADSINITNDVTGYYPAQSMAVKGVSTSNMSPTVTHQVFNPTIGDMSTPTYSTSISEAGVGFAMKSTVFKDFIYERLQQVKVSATITDEQTETVQGAQGLIPIYAYDQYNYDKRYLGSERLTVDNKLAVQQDDHNVNSNAIPLKVGKELNIPITILPGQRIFNNSESSFVAPHLYVTCLDGFTYRTSWYGAEMVYQSQPQGTGQPDKYYYFNFNSPKLSVQGTDLLGLWDYVPYGEIVHAIPIGTVEALNSQDQQCEPVFITPSVTSLIGGSGIIESDKEVPPHDMSYKAFVIPDASISANVETIPLRGPVIKLQRNTIISESPYGLDYHFRGDAIRFNEFESSPTTVADTMVFKDGSTLPFTLAPKATVSTGTTFTTMLTDASETIVEGAKIFKPKADVSSNSIVADGFVPLGGRAVKVGSPLWIPGGTLPSQVVASSPYAPAYQVQGAAINRLQTCEIKPVASSVIAARRYNTEINGDGTNSMYHTNKAPINFMHNCVLLTTTKTKDLTYLDAITGEIDTTSIEQNRFMFQENYFGYGQYAWDRALLTDTSSTVNLTNRWDGLFQAGTNIPSIDQELITSMFSAYKSGHLVPQGMGDILEIVAGYGHQIIAKVALSQFIQDPSDHTKVKRVPGTAGIAWYGGPRHAPHTYCPERRAFFITSPTHIGKKASSEVSRIVVAPNGTTVCYAMGKYYVSCAGKVGIRKSKVADKAIAIPTADTLPSYHWVEIQPNRQGERFVSMVEGLDGIHLVSNENNVYVVARIGKYRADNYVDIGQLEEPLSTSIVSYQYARPSILLGGDYSSTGVASISENSVYFSEDTTIQASLKALIYGVAYDKGSETTPANTPDMSNWSVNDRLIKILRNLGVTEVIE